MNVCRPLLESRAAQSHLQISGRVAMTAHTAWLCCSIAWNNNAELCSTRRKYWNLFTPLRCIVSFWGSWVNAFVTSTFPLHEEIGWYIQMITTNYWDCCALGCVLNSQIWDWVFFHSGIKKWIDAEGHDETQFFQSGWEFWDPHSCISVTSLSWHSLVQIFLVKARSFSIFRDLNVQLCCRDLWQWDVCISWQNVP